jgi:hypothetical protein
VRDARVMVVVSTSRRLHCNLGSFGTKGKHTDSVNECLLKGILKITIGHHAFALLSRQLPSKKSNTKATTK